MRPAVIEGFVCDLPLLKAAGRFNWYTIYRILRIHDVYVYLDYFAISFIYLTIFDK